MVSPHLQHTNHFMWFHVLLAILTTHSHLVNINPQCIESRNLQEISTGSRKILIGFARHKKISSREPAKETHIFPPEMSSDTTFYLHISTVDAKMQYIPGIEVAYTYVLYPIPIGWLPEPTTLSYQSQLNYFPLIRSLKLTALTWRDREWIIANSWLKKGVDDKTW